MFVIYMKYLPGNIFTNSVITSAAELIACLTAYFLYDKLGPRIAFVVTFAFSAIGSVLLIVFKSSTMATMFFISICKYGNGAAFAMIYLINFDFFPTVFVSTAFGLC